MASETIKALLMITLFGVLEALLYLPQLINSQVARGWYQAMLLHRPPWRTHAPVNHVLIPVRARRVRH